MKACGFLSTKKYFDKNEKETDGLNNDKLFYLEATKA